VACGHAPDRPHIVNNPAYVERPKKEEKTDPDDFASAVVEGVLGELFSID